MATSERSLAYGRCETTSLAQPGTLAAARTAASASGSAIVLNSSIVINPPDRGTQGAARLAVSCEGMGR